MVGELSVEAWVALWFACHSFIQGSPLRVEFPDGRPLDEQPALLVTMFSIVEGEFAKESEAQMRNAK